MTRGEHLWLALVAAVVIVVSGLYSLTVPERPPPVARPQVWPTATPTPTATPGWWVSLPWATPTLPPLPGLPTPGWLERPEDRGQGPVPFEPLECPGPEARITAIERRGVWWPVAGTAAVDPFWYWKMELSPDGRSWTLLYRSEAPVAGGRLMELHTGTVSPGSYRLRLTAVRRDGNYPAPCTVSVSIP